MSFPCEADGDSELEGSAAPAGFGAGGMRLVFTGISFSIATDFGADSTFFFRSTVILEGVSSSFFRIYRAAALSMGRLPEPHLGEWTQDGHPFSQGQLLICL